MQLLQPTQAVEVDGNAPGVGFFLVGYGLYSVKAGRGLGFFGVREVLVFAIFVERGFTNQGTWPPSGVSMVW